MKSASSTWPKGSKALSCLSLAIILMHSWAAHRAQNTSVQSQTNRKRYHAAWHYEPNKGRQVHERQSHPPPHKFAESR